MLVVQCMYANLLKRHSFCWDGPGNIMSRQSYRAGHKNGIDRNVLVTIAFFV